jgi:hypothetical protein
MVNSLQHFANFLSLSRAATVYNNAHLLIFLPVFVLFVIYKLINFQICLLFLD